jgi:hypothetical protein
MQNTLMQGLNEQDMSAVIHSYDLHEYLYPSLFPLKESLSLTWKMLEAQSGLRIAGDLVARGATIPRKTRDAISRISGDIPKISISREKLEDELNEYQKMYKLARSKADLAALVEFWAEDTKYCWNGVASRAEWIALKQISLGKVTITNTNNAAIVTEYDLDYEIPSSQKVGVEVAYTSGVAGKPFTKDFPKALKIGKSIGAKYKFAFMNLDTFAALAQQEEVSTFCATYLQKLADVTSAPGITEVNAYLSKQNHIFKGLQIVVIDQDITLELADGSRETSNPFEDNVILFSESKTLGHTFWTPPVDFGLEGSSAIKTMHGHTLIKKYSEEEPIKEVTLGIANLFPAWNLAGRSLLMQVDSTTWNKN